jgi:hypothetical protein
MHRPEFLMEVQDVAVEVAFPVQGQHLADHVQRHPLGRGLLPTPIEQSIVAPLLIPPFPAAHLAIRDPEDLGGLVPLQASIDGSQDHSLHLHRPLHGGGRVRGLLHEGSSFQKPLSYPVPAASPKRTFHVLREADTSHASVVRHKYLDILWEDLYDAFS